MTDLVLELTGHIDGVPQFSPVEMSDVKAIGGRKTLVLKLMSKKSALTSLQNRSIRLYVSKLALAFNDAGYDMKVVLEKLSKRFFIPWSPESVLEKLWRPTQLHTYGTKSTTKLETRQVTVVYEALNQVTAENFGISIPFPDQYSQMCEQLDRNSEK